MINRTHEALIAAFESARRNNLEARIEDFLPTGADRAAVLFELVHADLEFRLDAGESARIEDYLERFPELTADANALIELIQTEYEQRQRQSGLSVEEYLHRFPTLRAQLRACLPAMSFAQLRSASSERTRLGRFELLELLGQGATGVVHKAFDEQLERVVAVKQARLGPGSTLADVERFLREARHAARLHHPGIVTILEAGQLDNVCFLVSECVPGESLSDRLARGPLSCRQAAAVAAQLADALDYAHNQGIIHRDIKPANILLEPRATTTFSGARELSVEELIPRITDFGLAKHEGNDSTLTLAGQVLGTPAYMAPEQARGDAQECDARTDVYGLGAVLYEMLTGKAPFRGASRSIIRQVIEEEPTPPGRLRNDLPRDLQSICQKAMTKEPQGRYQCAADLASDLRRYLDGHAVGARPIGVVRRCLRWSRRNPLLAGLSASLLLSALVGFGGIVWAWRLAEARLAEVENARIRARDNLFRAHQTVSDFLPHNRFRVHYSLGFEQSRKEVALKARHFYEELLAESEEENLHTEQLAICLNRLMEIHMALRDWKQAQDFGRRGLAEWEFLAAAQPLVGAIQEGLAQNCLQSSALAAIAGDRQKAARDCARARTILEKLYEEMPGDAGVLRGLAYCQNSEGHLSRDGKEYAQALMWYTRALILWRKLVELDPETLEYRLEWATAAYYAADMQRETGELELSLDASKEACAIAGGLLSERPRLREAQDVRARSLYLHARVCALLNRTDVAAEYYQQAASAFEKLRDVEPAYVSYKRDLAATYHNLGVLALFKTDQVKAVFWLEKARDLRTELIAANPGNRGFQSDICGTRLRLGSVLDQIERSAEAVAELNQALLMLQSLKGGATERAAYERQEFKVNLELARVYSRLGRHAEARKAKLATFRCLPLFGL